MENLPSPSDKQSMVSSFMEIAAGQSADTARQFLQATSWQLEEAIQLFYVQNDGGAVASSSQFSQFPPVENVMHSPKETSAALRQCIENDFVAHDDGDVVRAPLPVIREALYEDAVLYRAPGMGYPNEASSLVAFRNFDDEMKRPGVWESDQGAAPAADNLASLYRPPFALMFHGPFEKAKVTASSSDKWLLVNLQSTKEFSSHMLNRDTWANEAVAQTISSNFIFWQVNEDTSEGRKVCAYYKSESIPLVLVIDPITGQKIRSWSGMIQPERLLEDLLPFMDSGPKDHHVSLSHKRPRENSQTPHKIKDASQAAVETNDDEEVQLALAASMANVKDPEEISSKNEGSACTSKVEGTPTTKLPSYPPLPEEPKGDRSLLCRVGIRLPDGRRLQRNFLRTDPLQLLWSFCHAQLGEAVTRPFRLTHAIPRASKCLDYENNQTLEEAGLANSMISLTWE